MLDIDDGDVAGLQAKLAGLDLTAGEQAALDQVLTLAGSAQEADVSGFEKPRPMFIGDLSSILGRTPPPPDIDYIVKSGGGNSI